MKEEEEVNYQNLLSKFFAGEISNSEIILLNDWIESDTENRRIFNNENEIWQAVSFNQTTDNNRIERVWLNISSGLGLGGNKKESVVIFRRDRIRILITAAVVASLIAIGGLVMRIRTNISHSNLMTATTVVSTHEGDKASIVLSDSTEVILNAGSSIKYDGQFNQTDRLVELKGEAYFDVSTNPGKPFIVKLDKLTITATGTRFNVFSFENEDRVETTLEEGKIEVSIKGMKPINVKSGQQVVYFVSSGKIQIRDVAIDTYTSWKENKLRFYDTPFEEVLRGIGRKYNVVFEIKDTNLLNLKYTATFIDESIEEVMQMLKTVSPITYEIYNRTSASDKQYLKPKIIIRGRGTI